MYRGKYLDQIETFIKLPFHSHSIYINTMVIKSRSEKKKKKQWYTILASKQFQHVKLGESRAYVIQDLMGKTLKINLMTLTNNPRGQSINLHFKIKNISENNCIADIIDYKISNSHIKRLVRKASNKLEESFLVKTKDGVAFRIKPLILTRYKANKSVLTDLRKKIYEIITEFISEKDSLDIYSQVISHKLQMEVKNSIKKIYPIAICEIKAFTLLSS